MKTSTFDREALLCTHILNWIILDLNGRYREYVSDQFLAYSLMYSVRAIVYTDKQRGQEHMEHPFNRREEIAYHAGCPIFEGNLEHNCRAGGNGHHVSQDFAKCILAFTVSPL